jgi:hypothetical protein
LGEIAHIGAGVSYLQKLDMRPNEEHPPLAKVLAALPLVFHGVHADYSQVSWTFSGNGFFKQFFREWIFGHWLITRWNEPLQTVFWARQPMLFLTLVVGVILFVHGRRLGDPWGGLLCLCAYATMPAMLAFGPLVLTDIAITLFVTLTLWTFANMWRSPTRVTILQFGLALGGASLSKFSAGLLFFCFPAFILSLHWRPVPGQPTDKAELRAWRRLRWWSLSKGVLFAALVVYVVYLFSRGTSQPTDSNLDWNHGLLDVHNFVRQRSLRRVLIDEYGFSHPTVYVPEAQFWNCQEAAPENGGKWAIVSANLIQESHNCVWLLR